MFDIDLENTYNVSYNEVRILASEHSMIRLFASTFIDECHLHASHYIIKFVPARYFGK